MRTAAVRRGFTAAAFTAAGLALAACGSGGSTAGPASSPSFPSNPPLAAAPSPATSTSAVPGGQSGTASTGPGAMSPQGQGAASRTTTAPCRTADLQISARDFDSGAGRTNFVIDFLNNGPEPCGLSGFPGVSFVDGHGAQIGNAADRVGTASAVVTLIPHAHTQADVQSSNGQSGYSAKECALTPVSGLKVFPPNQRESVTVPLKLQECAGASVHALKVGPVLRTR